jgi:hydroxymethylglutaryl-CoA lyase
VDQAAHSGNRLIGTELPGVVDVYEVGPRDGLQNEARVIATADKVRLIDALVAAGLKRVEATSFVPPKWIPQLADAEKVMAQVKRPPGVVFSALVPNLEGLARARDCGLQEAAVFLSVTESHSKKNLNKTVAEALTTVGEVAAGAANAGMRVRCYLSTVWGCPYEGKVSLEQVTGLCRKLQGLGLYQLSLGDTIGVGTPGQTAQIIESVAAIFGVEKLALHLHDTRGTALANALVGLQLGVTTLDSSSGGLGGCPYAPGAAGNLATEDLVYMLDGLGIQSGVALGKLVEAGELAQQLMARKLSGKYLQAALGEREKASHVRIGQT